MDRNEIVERHRKIKESAMDPAKVTARAEELHMERCGCGEPINPHWETVARKDLSRSLRIRAAALKRRMEPDATPGPKVKRAITPKKKGAR